ncbi:MAG: nucleotidyl transferase AbiEii/AbiGii toxin family protein [Syntrophales bacterium]
MFDRLLRQIGVCLDKSNLPYMIIGGQAVLLYGEPRLTKDIDITLGVGIEHLDRLLCAIEQIPLKPLPQDISTFVKQTIVLPALDESTGIRVDFIFSLTPYETQAIKKGNKVKILEHDICFASLEDLIIHKIFAGRPRDIEDVRVVMMKNPCIDIRYIEGWLKEFDSASDGKIFLETFQFLYNEVRKPRP